MAGVPVQPAHGLRDQLVVNVLTVNDFRVGQRVSPTCGRWLPFESGTISHLGRTTVGVTADDGSPYLVNPKWIVIED